jgi:hypothetical protein
VEAMLEQRQPLISTAQPAAAGAAKPLLLDFFFEKPSKDFKKK